MRPCRAVCVFCLVLSFALLPAVAQSDASRACGAAPVVDAHAKPNIFNTQQEEWLGEAWRDEFEARVSPIHDPSLNDYLQGIVDRMAKLLPQPHVAFHVVLVDSPEANAWTYPGGSIYVTRKLAATAHSEDEIAAVLGHEMGHVAAHQFAFESTAEMKRLLNVSSVTDRNDVYTKYQQLVDAEMKDRHASKVNEDDDQDEADVIGVYLAAAAGFNPKAFPEFFDREFFLEGKTGNRLLDIFGLTRPDQKRLRGMRAMVAALPAGCGGQSTPEEFHTFLEWQKRVTENRKVDASIHLAGSTEIKLSQPLQMEVGRVHFSPDGKYLLAQDDSSIYVLDVTTAKVLFRIDADNAHAAWFSPDSKSVTFSTSGMHTERWDIATQKMAEAHEPLAKYSCTQTLLSPDGRTLICVSLGGPSQQLNLEVLNAETGDLVWEQKGFVQPTTLRDYYVMPTVAAYSSLSADGNYLLIGYGASKLAFDLRTRMPVKIADGVKYKINGAYAFVGSEKVVGANLADMSNSGIYSFPDGKLLQKLAVTLPDMAAVSEANDRILVTTHALYGLTPAEATGKKSVDAQKDAIKVELRVGLADLAAKKYIYASYSNALDISHNLVATETPDGNIAIGTLASAGWALSDVHKVALPDSRLGVLNGVDISPDGRYMAYSTRDRAGVWDVQTGSRIALMKAFSAVHWTGDKTFVAEFEKTAKGDRELISFDMSKNENHVVPLTVSHDDKSPAYMWYQSFTEWRSQPKSKGRQLLFHRLDDGSVAWTKDFPEGYPRWTQSYGGKDLIFSYPLNTDAAKNALAHDPALQSEAAAIHKREDGRLIEVVDAADGTTLARMVFEMPGDYIGTNGLNRSGDSLYVTGEDNRTLVYSLKTGKQMWKAYGWVSALDTTTNRVCISNRADEAIIYTPEGKELNHLRLGTPVRFMDFTHAGERLFLLTADQHVHVVNVIREPEAVTATASR